MQNSRKGEFARQRLKGKQAIELGAGMGLCSLAFAAMGCDVLSTDVKSVVPLLSINCASNLNSVALDGALILVLAYCPAALNCSNSVSVTCFNH